MKNSEMKQGADFSFYQDDINEEKTQDLLDFVIPRSSQNLYTDTWFLRNWKKFTRRPRTSYHLYDWRPSGANPTAQGKYFRELIGNIRNPTMDFELPWEGWSPVPFPEREKAFNHMRMFRDAVASERMTLYINVSTLKTLQPFPNWLIDEWDLWIAAYLKVLKPVTWAMMQNGISNEWVVKDGVYHYWDVIRSFDEIPDDRSPETFGWPWKMWQFTNVLNGEYYGMKSKGLDGNLFNGTTEELNECFGFETQEEEKVIDLDIPDVIEPEVVEEAKMHFRSKYSMNVRTGPGTAYPRVETMDPGTIVEAQDIGGADAWIKIGDDRWVCKSQYGADYLTKE